MKKPSIPAINAKDGELQRVLLALKENAEILNGTRGGRLEPLASNASTADLIAKVNEIIERLNA